MSFIEELEGPVGIPLDEGRVFKKYDGFLYDENIEIAWKNRKTFDVVLIEAEVDKLYFSHSPD